jgi:hypothetical protein
MRPFALTISLTFLLGLALWGIAQNGPEAQLNKDSTDYSNLREIPNEAFHVGEELRYRVHYGFINAGEAFVRVNKETQIGGRPVYHIHGEGHSTGMFRWGYKVDYLYDSYMDTEMLAPWEFVRNVRDGGYKLYREINFDHIQESAYCDGDTFDVPIYVQDLLSAFYYSRTFDLENLQIGDSITITTFIDHELYPLALVYQGNKIVSSDLGRIECLSFQPIVQVGRVFKEAEGMTIFVSNDANKIPIQLRSELMFGSVKMDLTEAKGLVRPLRILD